MSTTADRIRQIMDELGVDQPALGQLARTSKAMVNHWLTGKVKSVSAEFAYNLESSTPFNAKWIQTGTGEPRKIAGDALLARYQQADPATRALIDLALSDPASPVPDGLSPSIKALIDSVRTMLAEQLRSSPSDT